MIAVWRSTRHAAEQERSAWYDQVTGLPNLAKLRQLYLRRREDARDGEEHLGRARGRHGPPRRRRCSPSVTRRWKTCSATPLAAYRPTSAQVMSSSRRADDMFAVLAPLTEADAEDDLRALAERLLACMAEPFQLSGIRVDLQATIGATTTHTAEEDPAVLLRRAGAALRAAQADARGTLRIFQPGMRSPPRSSCP